MSLSIAKDIDIAVNNALQAVIALAYLVSEVGVNNFDFNKVAQNLIAETKLPAALALAPGGTVQYMYPLEGNRAAIGHNLLKDPARRVEVTEAITQNKAILSGPVTMVQGGIGLFVRKPIFLGTKSKPLFWGLAIALIRWDDLLQIISQQIKPESGVSFQITRQLSSDKASVIIGGKTSLPANGITATQKIRIPGGFWTITTSMLSNGWKDYAPSLLFIFIFTTSLLIAVVSLINRHEKTLLQKNKITKDSIELQKSLISQQEQNEIANSKIKDLATIFNNISALISYRDLTNTIIYINSAAAENIGKRPDEICGHNISEFYTNYTDSLLETDQDVIMSGTPRLQVTSKIQTISGEEHWLRTDKIPITQSDGRVIGILNFSVDITELKVNEEALKAVTNRYINLTRQIPAGVYALRLPADRIPKIEFLSENGCIMLGISEDEAKNDFDSVYKNIHPDDKKSMEDLNRVALTRFEMFQWEGRYVINNEIRWLHIESIPNHISGNTYIWNGIIIDITKHKALEQQLKFLATTDELTAINNRRHFLELGNTSVQQSNDANASITVAIIDIDHFKHINDEFGHACGDAVLQSFSKAAAAAFDSLGIIGRIGGEEFGLILNGADSRASEASLEQFRKNISNMDIRYGAVEIHMTISCGAYTKEPAESRTLSYMLTLADNALYAAKSQGRNKVVVTRQKASGSPDPQAA